MPRNKKNPPFVWGEAYIRDRSGEEMRINKDFSIFLSQPQGESLARWTLFQGPYRKIVTQGNIWLSKRDADPYTEEIKDTAIREAMEYFGTQGRLFAAAYKDSIAMGYAADTTGKGDDTK